ncbi:hypothetical protein GXB85_01525 [Cellulomonas sp. APG4]|uniref:hypothetical protein n=1 Tax=Cellulomonas sp. APG4 TaxID=1538656 RepID=UPI00137B34AF|nr:hypothetical protein [Cellulomonas sp. APG4]NCT89639.1 hypothetical protein [Cellulomonas sp. APG4]
MTRTPVDDAPTAAPALADRLRREWYLARLDWAMQDYPRREFRRIRADLRAELAPAAAEVGMRQALADLGHPRTLAERYTAELGRKLPRWTAGTVVAGVAVGVVAYLTFAYAFGSLDTLEALGGGSVTLHPLGGEVVLTHTDDEISVQSSGSWGWLTLYAGVAVVSFALGSRLWRAF